MDNWDLGNEILPIVGGQLGGDKIFVWRIVFGTVRPPGNYEIRRLGKLGHFFNTLGS
jgi:hypothetical protein